MVRLFLFYLFLQSYLLASPKSDILYKARMGNVKDAVILYNNFRACNGGDDLELIEKMAFAILDQGFRSNDPKEQFAATFGAGMARSTKLLYILEEGIKNEIPQIQLISLIFLNELHDDVADELIKGAMSSNYLPIRLEAAKILAARKDGDTTDRIEGLMCKLDSDLHFLFPPFFAASSEEHATSLLKRCFTEKNSNIRLSCILSCIDFHRDDLLPQIRTLATCGNIDEQEASIYALGTFQDTSSLPQIKLACHSPYTNVRLSALISLMNLGCLDVKEHIEAMALKDNVYAITALGDVVGSEEVLYQLCQSPKLQIRGNAAIALLKRRDPRCIPTLLEILIKDSRDLGIKESRSPGYVLSSWNLTPCATSKTEAASQDAAMILAIKEALIRAAVDLPKENFFQFASKILDSKDPELIPALIASVSILKCKESTDFLIRELQRVGAPLVRAYCNLALFQLKEPGPYALFVRQWVKDLKHIEMIDFKLISPRDRGLSTYSLTPQETCKLFIKAAISLAEEKDQESLGALLTALCLGHPKNRFTLAGLIIRAIE